MVRARVCVTTHAHFWENLLENSQVEGATGAERKSPTPRTETRRGLLARLKVLRVWLAGLLLQCASTSEACAPVHDSLPARGMKGECCFVETRANTGPSGTLPGQLTLFQWRGVHTSGDTVVTDHRGNIQTGGLFAMGIRRSRTPAYRNISTLERRGKEPLVLLDGTSIEFSVDWTKEEAKIWRRRANLTRPNRVSNGWL